MVHREVIHFAEDAVAVRHRLRRSLPGPGVGALRIAGARRDSGVTGLVLGRRVWVRPTYGSASLHAQGLYGARLSGWLRPSPGGGCDLVYRLLPAPSSRLPQVLLPLGMLLLAVGMVVGLAERSLVIGVIAAAPGLMALGLVANWRLGGRTVAVSSTNDLDTWLAGLHAST